MWLIRHSEPLNSIPFKGLVTTGEKPTDRETWQSYPELHLPEFSSQGCMNTSYKRKLKIKLILGNNTL